MFDIYITQCKLPQKDGTDKCVNIGILNGKIKSIIESRNENNSIYSKKIIDAKGLYVMSGFVDNHSHTDESCFNPLFQSKIAQGITTEICGNCGGSPAPLSSLSSLKKRKKIKKIEDDYYTEYKWRNFREYFEKINKYKAVCNQVSLVGWWSLYDDCKYQNISESNMVGFLDKSLKAGCYGVSINQLSYSWVNLSQELKREIFNLLGQHNDKIFAVHLADYSDNFIQSINEIENLSSIYGVSIMYSHMKFYGKSRNDNYKFFKYIINRNEAYFDIYPFDSICTRLSNFLVNFKKNVHSFGATELTLLREGKEFTLSRQCELDIIEYELQRYLKNNGETLIMVKCIDINFLNELICSDKCLIGTDYSSCIISEDSRKKNHSRAFDTITNSISLLMENGFSMYEINKKLSIKPAEVWKIRDRGRIKEGNYADIVLASIDTYNQIKIKYVLLNGKLAFDGRQELIEKCGVAIT